MIDGATAQDSYQPFEAITILTTESITGTSTIVGLNYGFQGQMKLDEVTGGSPYGATTIAGGDGSRQPSKNELAGARYQGKATAEIAKKLHG